MIVREGGSARTGWFYHCGITLYVPSSLFPFLSASLGCPKRPSRLTQAPFSMSVDYSACRIAVYSGARRIALPSPIRFPHHSSFPPHSFRSPSRNLFHRHFLMTKYLLSHIVDATLSVLISSFFFFFTLLKRANREKYGCARLQRAVVSTSQTPILVSILVSIREEGAHHPCCCIWGHRSPDSTGNVQRTTSTEHQIRSRVDHNCKCGSLYLCVNTMYANFSNKYIWIRPNPPGHPSNLGHLKWITREWVRDQSTTLWFLVAKKEETMQQHGWCAPSSRMLTRILTRMGV